MDGPRATAFGATRCRKGSRGVRRAIVTGILLFVAASAVAGSPIDTIAAAELLVESILPELGAVDADYIAFLYPERLTRGDTLAPYAPTQIPEAVDRLPHLIPYELTGPTWFAWVDLDPYARYAHDTLFVLISADEGTYSVHHERWWPVLNGVSLWVDDAEYWSERDWVASTLSGGRPCGASSAVCNPEAPGSDYFDWALVINGWSPGQPGEPGLAADAGEVCATLGRLGMRVSALGPGDASPESLEAFVVRLFTETPLYHCCDRLYFYIAAHASPGALWIGGERLSSGELARMLTTPGDTYVPSRVYVVLEAGYGGSFLPDLSSHSNINRVWTAAAADEPAYGDLDPDGDPNPQDVGGEWTSSFVAAAHRLLADDPISIRAVEYGREYVPLNRAMRASGAVNAAVLGGLSSPAEYVLTEAKPELLQTAIDYLARYDRAHHEAAGNLEEIIDAYDEMPCLEFLWFLHRSARHDPIPAPTPAFSYRVLKGYARDVAHSDWWEFCDLFWSVFTTDGDGP